MYGTILMDAGEDVLRRAETRQDGQAVVVRRATPADVGAITALIQTHAARGNLLPRSRQNIEKTLPDWLVATGAEPSPSILGCVNLYPYGPTLFEVRSLAVADDARGEGVGTRLLETLEDAARHRGARTLFALTRAVRFFERQGFTVTSRDRFPEKVWNACRLCPLLDNCDEIAVEKIISDRGLAAGAG